MHDEFAFFDEGGTATIYKNDYIMLKKYKSYCPSKLRISENVFNVLKDINNSSFVKLNDIIIGNDQIDGYTYNYIPSNNINIVDESVDYTLENLKKLEKLIKKFNKLHITMIDTKSTNAILQNNNIVIIDPDMYFIDNSTDTRIINNKALIELFKSLYLNCFYGYSFEYENIINDLFDIDISKKDLTRELSKKLICKRPIDIIKK